MQMVCILWLFPDRIQTFISKVLFMKRSWTVLVIFFIGCLGAYAGQPNKISDRHVIDGRAQGTTYHIVYYAEKTIPKSAIDSMLNDIDNSMSVYNKNSLISKFNLPETTSIEMDHHMQKVVNKSFAYYKLSKGQFDITVAPLVQLWGFGPARISALPDEEQIRETLKNVGMNQLKVRGKLLLKKNPKVSIDLNGIAQGYSVDVLADYLLQQGIQNFIVELGGELRINGKKSDGERLKVGIERPVKTNGNTELKQDVIVPPGGAITTAGNFEKFLMDKNRKITHHINPKTGYSFETNIVSVTVHAPTAMEGDALDNIFMAMSPDEAIVFANKIKNIDIYIIYNNQQGDILEKHTKGFENLFDINPIPNLSL